MSHREKSENRRALPKFLLILLGSLVLGAGLGVLVALADFSGGGEAAARVLRELLRRIAPWGIPALAAVLGGGGLILYLRAWGRANRWDGEDEEEAEAVENLLDWVLLCSSALLVASFFFFAVGVCFELGLMETVLPFILSIALVILLQQKAVDLTKRMNPEKKGHQVPKEVVCQLRRGGAGPDRPGGHDGLPGRQRGVPGAVAGSGDAGHGRGSGASAGVPGVADLGRLPALLHRRLHPHDPPEGPGVTLERGLCTP